MHQPLTHPDADRASATISAGALLAALVALLGADNLLLLRFLGLGGVSAIIAGGAVLAILCRACVRGLDARVPVRRVIACLAVALVVLLLGGEGRLLFANADWQVRDALAADLARAPWPFAYVGHGPALLPRLPLGMYLLPALGGKLGGQGAADLALLAQNAAVLGVLLSLGSLLARDTRRRRVLLLVTLGFGGLDLVGAALLRPDRLLPLTRNIESWGPTIFESNLASAYWAPQHALTAWIGATLFLLWREGRLPLRLFLTPLPLLALWSPLALAGTLPFAGLAGVETLWRRRLTAADVFLPALALALAVVPLLYLRADAGAVGASIQHIPPLPYLLFELIEVVPFLACALVATRGGRFGTATVALVAACLLVFPFIDVGESVDFCMRAGAPALAILSVLCADAVAEGRGRARTLLIGLLLVGAVSPVRDTLRAIAYRPAPPPRCDLWGAWQTSFWYQGKETYVARVERLTPPLDRIRPYPLAPLSTTACWSRPWFSPRWPAAARWLGAEHR